MSRHLLFPSICLFLFLSTTTALAEDAGSRPMNVAVSPDGNTVLATSMGSTSITQAKWNGTDFTKSSISVNAPSWGVTFIDNLTAVVTHPGERSLSVLTRDSATASFTRARGIELGNQFRNSTEIITNPSTSQVFIANRGLPLPGVSVALSWTNAVFCVDIANDQLIGSFVTEREPRALVTHADRLFVGTVRGALGGTPLATNNSLADNYQGGDLIGDGGSILVYDLTDWNSNLPMEPLDGERIGVGSPVRGIAVSGNANNSYSVYYTSVGDEANSEDPEEEAENGDEFGGRSIPNVINALYYSSSNVLQDTVSAVFEHHPDWYYGTPFFTGMTGGPAVLPDKIVVRDVTIGGQRTRELLITNSGSGTFSRTPLTAGGKLQFSADSLVTLPRVRLHRDGSVTEEIDIIDEDVTYKKLLPVTNGGTNVSHVDLSREGQPLLKFTSNARGLAYDPVRDNIWVATQFDNELIQITVTGNSNTIGQRFDTGASVETAPGSARNFFGFGRGFEFRQVETFAHATEGPAARVGTQTCGTCHVDGHTDGKVRLTKRVATNLNGNSLRKPVAVPSVFDVGQTEWIFFEGLKTIDDGDFGGDTDCDYCNQNGFFDNTEAFTDGLTSPPSPHDWSGTLASSALRGRHVFEAMNCSRCHMGAPQPFTRTNHIQTDMEGRPLQGPLTNSNRMLNDLTQVFVSVAEQLSRHNMTDVGTRLAGDGTANGINTPALAGLWDNRPYMHDGRYRTLDDVLANTWLKDAPAFRAAPIVMHPNIPDNSRVNGDIEDLSQLNTLMEFHTHHHGSSGMSGWTTVASKLSSTDYADLKAFLLSLSSQTDPCSGGADDFVLNLSIITGHKVRCTSPVKIQCRFAWDGPIPWTYTSAWGTTHTSSPPSGAEDGTYIVTVTPLVRPICGDPDIEQITVELGEEYTYSTDAPKVTEMAAGRPNPFNPTTTIAFALAKADHVSIVVYDAAGRVVRTLVDENRKPARYSVVWDGSDDRGAPVASGVYFCRMIAGSYQSTQKLVLLK